MAGFKTLVWPLALCLFLLIAVAGGVLILTANNTLPEASSLESWRKTDGRLQEFKITYRPALKNAGYVATASYSFKANGREHSGHGVLGETRAESAELLKQRFKPWLGDPLARVTEQATPVSYEYSYAPLANVVVPVYFDPADPEQSFFGTPSTKMPDYVVPMRLFGMLLGAVACVGVAVLLFVWRSKPLVNTTRRFYEARAAAGLRMPTLDEEREFVKRAAAAIQTIETAMREDPIYLKLQPVLDVLQDMQKKPSQTLLHDERLGFGRWLSGEWDLEGWGSAGIRVLAATGELESFHQKWRDQAKLP